MTIEDVAVFDLTVLGAGPKAAELPPRPMS